MSMLPRKGKIMHLKNDIVFFGKNYPAMSVRVVEKGGVTIVASPVENGTNNVDYIALELEKIYVPDYFIVSSETLIRGPKSFDNKEVHCLSCLTMNK